MLTTSFNRDVIVIGASLGGVEALRELFAVLPVNLNAAALVVWHMPPEAPPSILPNLLNSAGPLPVGAAEDGELLEPGRAYIARPDHHLMVETNGHSDAGIVRLTRGPKENRFRPSIDVLFRSAAMAFGPRVIGVVLTGALDDGASGLYAIKERGGLAVVQDPLEAHCPSMPISAMRAVQVDHVVRIAQMGELLQQLTSHRLEQGGGAVEMQPASKRMETEIAVAKEDSGYEKGIMELGELSPYTCPECHGTLVQIKEGSITRFRCHTGHGFTLDALLAEVTKATEDALWNALRAIEEVEMLTGHLAKHLEAAGEHAAAEACLQRMVNAMRQANLVRQATMQNEVLSVDKIEAQPSS